MVSAQYKECLAEIYLGEQHGEVIFETLLASAKDDYQRYALGSLLQLETEAKAIIRPTLFRLGLPVSETPSARAEAVELVNVVKDLSWEEQFAVMAQGIEAEFLARYEELALLVTPEEDAESFKLAKFMGKHERAVMNAASNVATGAADPLAPVIELLHFPLVFPSVD